MRRFTARAEVRMLATDMDEALVKVTSTLFDACNEGRVADFYIIEIAEDAEKEDEEA